MTAAEYRDEVSARSEAYAQEAETVRSGHLSRLEQAVNDLVGEFEGEALQRAAVAATAQHTSALFAAVADAVDRYTIDLEAMEPPGPLEGAHGEYVDALRLSIDGLGVTLDALAAASSFDEIDAAIGGSTFNDTQHRVDAACRSLEEALVDEGVPANLHCRQD